jgi:hypothetical protein
LLDLMDLRIAAALMLAAGVVLPLVPGYPGLACPWRTVTGIPCPLCGMSTSVEATLRLHLRDAFAANPAGIAAVIAAVALLVTRPRRLVVPRAVIPVTLMVMWIFELFRFKVL